MKQKLQQDVSELEKMRHSASHVLAQAVLKFYPDAKLGIGPAIDNGFYYDFHFTEPITDADLQKIEDEMREIIRRDLPIHREYKSRDEVINYFKSKGEKYKLDLINDIPDEQMSLFITGEDEFTDLCRGPHVASTGKIKAIKLTKIAGAYWRGDEKQEMLTRIYGLAFDTQEEIDNYISNLEEAEKRDHRKLGPQLDLFHIDSQVGQGLVLWHPKGAMLWRQIEDFWYKEHIKAGYELVRSPHIGNRQLWETSGHWGFYNSSMYPALEVGQTLEDSQQGKAVEVSEQYLLKPMNCPFHVRIFKANLHSYRELPFRWAETGTVYRYEKAGELSGLVRVRGFTQDDAHIICSKEQVREELARVVNFILFIYKSFGFDPEDVSVYLSLRDPNKKDKYAGDDAGWEFTESVLREVADNMKLSYVEQKGEAAFYGPKLDFKIKDVIGREWQCSTLQFDFNLPERFDMTFTNQNGEFERPYMLHRALFGSFERFIGLLIEHYNGAFPLWIAPVQVKILSIADRHSEYAQKVLNMMLDNDIRASLDSRNESLQSKIRDSQMQKIPYTVIIGDKEISVNGVSVRPRGKNDLGLIDTERFIEMLKKEVASKGAELVSNNDDSEKQVIKEVKI
ncbi:MAG TPA: threonine--tRNA ligase [Candidatus Dojkabacteria bacterium]|nr:threonine--tRNA ligase [Candidatus Dojkabacteria bacterium]